MLLRGNLSEQILRLEREHHSYACMAYVCTAVGCRWNSFLHLSKGEMRGVGIF